MSTHSTPTITAVVLSALLLTVVLFGSDRTVLNGTWTLEPTKSDFAGQPVVQTGTVTISDHEGTIIVTRNFVYEGAGETFFYKDSIGTENNATIRAGKDLKTKAKWDHDVLKVTTTQSGAVTVESYALSPDGTMTVNVVRPDHKLITLLFQRK